MSHPDNPQQPPWFKTAVSTPFTDHWVESGGCRIHYQFWQIGSPSKPGLMLIHGHGAHSHWWDFIAPYLTGRYRVLAMDVSGAGDSAHRDQYSDQQFAQEVLDVKRDAGFDQRTILIGHSFGGRIARSTIYNHGSGFAGLVLADSAMALPGRRTVTTKLKVSNRPDRHYPSQTEAARRFRLRPPQRCSNDYIIDYIARHSVRDKNGLWYWKLDQNVFARMSDLQESLDPGAMIRSMACKVGVIYGEHSRFFNSEVISYLRELIPAEYLLNIADAQHHLFLDQPLPFVKALDQLLASWEREPGYS